MTFPDEFPDSAVPEEQLRSLYHGLFEQRFTEHPELNQFADERAEALARAFAEFNGEGMDHPSLPTLKSGVKKLLFTFTDREDFSVAPTDEDIAVLLLEFYEACEDNLQITANALDTYANHMPLYVQEGQAVAGERWGQMDGSQRLLFVREFAHERMQEDFE